MEPSHAEPPRPPGAFERAYVAANRVLIVAMMASMVALVFANVVARYFLNTSIVWAEELSQYLMVWIAFLGAGLALREGRHVSVDLLQDALGPAARRALRWLIALVLLAFMATLVVLGFRFAEFAWDLETPMMQARLGIVYLAVPVGALVFVVHLLFIWRDYIAKRFEEPENLEPPVPADLATPAGKG
jgi:TRAP-type C4-dicarboxylate transport system permease small subunit